jgi:Predicted hydrolases or acyltransferases (alpha/beta hydrolase superfamily)
MGRFHGANRLGAKFSQAVRDTFWLHGMQAGFNSVFDCIKAFSETDHTQDLKQIDVRTLILRGDDDQIVPIGGSPLLSPKLMKRSTLKVYPGFSHGMCTDQQGPDQRRSSGLHQRGLKRHAAFLVYRDLAPSTASSQARQHRLDPQARPPLEEP